MEVVTMLQQGPEPLPDWLRQTPPGFDRKSFFGGKTVYYPGCGNDGHPVSICARAHAAHAFVYVDYGVSKETVSERVEGVGDPGFIGYFVEHEEEVGESDLRPGGWNQHVEQRELARDAYSFANVTPYGLFIVLKRNEDRDDSHGRNRLAILFVGGDGHATYDALYCQADGTPPPFLVVVEDYYGFGANFSPFAAGGLLERVARRFTCFRSSCWSTHVAAAEASDLGPVTETWGSHQSMAACTADPVGSFVARSRKSAHVRYLRPAIPRGDTPGTGFFGETNDQPLSHPHQTARRQHRHVRHLSILFGQRRSWRRLASRRNQRIQGLGSV